MKELDIQTLVLTIGVLRSMNLFTDKQVEVFLHRLIARATFSQRYDDDLAYATERIAVTCEFFFRIHPELKPNENIEVVK